MKMVDTYVSPFIVISIYGGTAAIFTAAAISKTVCALCVPARLLRDKLW